MTEPKAEITRAGKLLIVIGLAAAVIGLLLLLLDLVAIALLVIGCD